MQMVTAAQQSLVQHSWDKLEPLITHVAELFYDRLFELDPSLEELLPASLTEPSTQLVQVLGQAVAGANDLSRIAPVVRELGRRHREYGMRVGHYVTAGDALLWTLEQSLAEDFTPRMKEAWEATYQALSALLLDGAKARSTDAGSAPRAGLVSATLPGVLPGARQQAG
jgi:hemoglobin-like flavoprotein